MIDPELLFFIETWPCSLSTRKYGILKKFCCSLPEYIYGPGMMEIGRLSDRVRELGDNMKSDSVNARRLIANADDNNDRWRS